MQDDASTQVQRMLDAMEGRDPAEVSPEESARHMGSGAQAYVAGLLSEDELKQVADCVRPPTS